MDIGIHAVPVGEYEVRVHNSIRQPAMTLVGM
jgi:hypothetical protein